MVCCFRVFFLLYEPSLGSFSDLGRLELVSQISKFDKRVVLLLMGLFFLIHILDRVIRETINDAG